MKLQYWAGNTHRKKNVFMTSFHGNLSIDITHDEIEKVESYRYLNKTVKIKAIDNTKKEVLIRIRAGWSCFDRYKDILCDKTLPLMLRRICVYSVTRHDTSMC